MYKMTLKDSVEGGTYIYIYIQEVGQTEANIEELDRDYITITYN
jgi:hypothetical protein